jgi:pimeloyl-ACP methyl ester carboxylesterase
MTLAVRDEGEGQPVLLIHGFPDSSLLWRHQVPYLVEDRMVESGAFVDGPWRYERIEDASHWMQLDAPDRVNELLLELLG